MLDCSRLVQKLTVVFSKKYDAISTPGDRSRRVMLLYYTRNLRKNTRIFRLTTERYNETDLFQKVFLRIFRTKTSADIEGLIFIQKLSEKMS